MIFHEVELSHTKEIMDSYEVNPIIAKYVEHRGFTKEDYEACLLYTSDAADD